MKKFFFNPLEERIVLDAAAAHDIAAVQQDAPPVELLVVANTVPDAQLLELAAKSNVRVVTYDPSNSTPNSLDHLIQVATAGEKIDSIGFVAEGKVGAFALFDNSVLDANSLSSDSAMQAFWRDVASYLVPGGSINLFACNVAGGAIGQDFVNSFSDFLHETNNTLVLRASTDLTGAADLGGDWTLEYSSDGAGAYDGTAFFDAQSLAGWDHTLPIFRAFSSRYSADIYGNMTITGNTVLTDNGTSPDGDNNNPTVMSYIDVDGDGTTFNSTRATLSMPGGSTVVWAGLYWGADDGVDPDGGSGPRATTVAAPNPAAIGTVLLDTPVANNVVVNSSTLDINLVGPSNLGQRFSAFADVTSLVQAGGAGLYTVANLQAGTGNGIYGGWTLLVVYGNPSSPHQYINVFDGYANVTTTDNVLSIPISGFQTPSVGPVSTTVAIVAHEGDFSLRPDPDSVNLDGTPLFTALSPVGNFFNSTIDTFGSDIGGRNPTNSDQFGYDIKLVDASGILSPGQTSTTFQFTTGTSSTDAYRPVLMAFATEVPGINVTPTSGLTTTEAGGSTSFSIVLTSQPTSDVTIPLSSSDTTEGVLSVPSVTFTSGNWNIAQNVLVTGVDDAVDDGNIAYSIITGAATSADSSYNGQNASDVSLVNIDNDTAGITVSPTSGLVTTEAGGTANFSIVLTSQPTANVVIPIATSDGTEGTVSTSSLTFTPGNWNIAQNVTITGVDDFLADGNVSYAIITGPTSSADANYNLLNPADPTVVNLNDDVVGITVSPTSGLVTTEAGGSDSFSVVLTSAPFAPVNISVTSSDLTEGTVSTGMLTFDGSNWNIPQLVVVTGVDDPIIDPNVPYTVILGAATSADGAYNGLNPSDVSVVNLNDDFPGVNFTPVGGSVITTESGGSGAVLVTLTAQPSAPVFVPIYSTDTTEGSVGTSLLLFTTATWNIPQLVTVTGVNDFIDDGDIAYSIAAGPTASSDPFYVGITSSTSALNIDNDTAGLVISPSGGLTTTEAGGTAAINFYLASQPTAPVTISLATTDGTEAVPTVSSLTFTPGNWNVPQFATISGVDDLIDDGNIGYAINISAASGDALYNGLTSSVSGTNVDNDTAGATLFPVSGLTTAESGTSVTFSVVLNAQPTANVVIPIASSDPTEGVPNVSSLTFTPGNWNVAQVVTVTGVNDFIIDGTVPYTIITGPASSADSAYNGLNPSDVLLTNSDNDTASMLVTPPGGGVTTTEAGGSSVISVVLGAQPTGNVTIPVGSTDTTEGTVSTGLLTFTPGNWNIPQNVTVTGVDDLIDDGNVNYSIVFGPSSSSDPAFVGFSSTNGAVNADNDTAGMIVTPTSGLVTTEAGGTATFTVVLQSQPTGNVSVPITSGDPTEASPTSLLTFTPANWNIPQTVVVTGVDEFIDDGNIPYTIFVGGTTSSDPLYSGLSSTVTGTTIDNDTFGITATLVDGTTSESGGTGSISFVLNSQPTGTVVIPISSTDPTEGLPTTSSIVFTPGNWNIPQTVAINGQDDFIADGTVPYTVVTGAASSSDPNYNGVNPPDFAMTNSDNEPPVSISSIVVTPTLGLTTSEAGGTSSFTVVLSSQPTANVTIPVTSSDVTEGVPNLSSITFTSVNWNLPQTVTVVGQNDFLSDGNIPYTVLLGTVVSADPGYNGLDPTDVSLVNTDNDPSPAIQVTQIGSSTTSESGSATSFSFVLASQPTANVVIPVSSSDLTEGLTNVSSLTFTPGNWNTPQTVVVTGQSDFLSDGNISYQFVTGAATSADAGYNGINPSDFSLVNTDTSPSPNVIVSSPSSFTTTEGGATSSFTVVLASQPSANVTIPVVSTDTTEGVPILSSLTFTPGNWNIPQTVVVTGQNDFIADGSIPYVVSLGPSASGDAGYNGLTSTGVSLINLDNEPAPQIAVVSPPSGTTTTEAGGAVTTSFVLTTQPTGNVTIPIVSSDPTEGIPNVSSLTFTPGNWNVPQTVTITGQDDLMSDGNLPYTVSFGPSSSSDPNYAGFPLPTLSLTNVDNDLPAGGGVSIIGSPTTTEGGGTSSFTIVLNSQPTGNVTIPIYSSDPTEGVPNVTSVTFTPGNWNIPQTVVITGVDDLSSDGSVPYTIVTGPAASSDPNYNGINLPDVSVTNSDNDLPASVIISAPSGTTTTEAGGTVTYTLVLASQPTGNVIIPISSSDPTEGVPNTLAVTFTSANWNIPQTITVTGQNDLLGDGTVPYTIINGNAISTDPGYNGLNPADISISNLDNDPIPAIISSAPSSGNTNESGGTSTFTLVLSTQPTGNVTIPISSSDPTEGSTSVSSVTFTPANWNIPQAVTVTGVNDFMADGSQPYTVVIGAASSSDPSYNGFNLPDIPLVNLDNDPIAGGTANVTGPSTTTEGGGTTTFTVVLTTQPTGNVTIPVSSSDPTEGIPNTSLLVFTPGNWNVPQTVTITGQDDLQSDGNLPYTIVLGPMSSSDPGYNGVDLPDISLTNADNELAAAAGVVMLAPSQTTESGGTTSFAISLVSQPTSNVIIPLISSDPTEGIPGVSSVTFTPANWNVPQIVTVIGQDDAIDDGNINYQLLIGPMVSADPTYNGVNPSDLSLVNIDNDTAGVTLSKKVLVTSEFGTSDTFTVVLDTQPTANVLVTFSGLDVTEGSVNTLTALFTPANWNIAQTIIVTGVDDPIVDGNIIYNLVGTVTSSDSVYNGLAPDPQVTNLDNDLPGIIVTPIDATTSEAGDPGLFTVVLQSQPTGNVTIPLYSSDTTEGTIVIGSLTFTPLNWNIPQAVSVTGVGDAIDDGNVAYNIVLGSAVSSDAAFNGINPADVAMVNLDDDTAGVLIAPITSNPLATTEAGGTAQFSVVLTSQPTANVLVTFTTSDGTEGSMVTPSALFTPANWNIPQIMTVIGVNDPIVDGNIAYSVISNVITSADSSYSGMNPVDLAAINADNDTIGVGASTGSGGAGGSLTTSEAGQNDLLSLVLSSQPTGNVTIPISSSDPSEGVPAISSVTFTPTNWNTPQLIPIIGQDDALVDGNINYSIILGPATSTDLNYNGVDFPDVAAVNVDNDVASIIVVPIATTTTESGGTGQFAVYLTSAPTSPVILPISSSDPTEGAASTSSLTFNSSNWSTPQIVTITGLSDGSHDGNQAYTIVTGPSISVDAHYSGYNPIDVQMVNIDIDPVTPPVVQPPHSTVPSQQSVCSCCCSCLFLRAYQSYYGW